MNTVKWTKTPTAVRFLRAIEKHLETQLKDNSVPTIFRSAVNELFHAGGKLTRPVLVLAASEATGKPLNRLALDSAVAIELVHLSSLILDDIIDESPRRRGIRTLHKNYGNDVAIVSAGMLLLKGLKAIAEFKTVRSIGYNGLHRLLVGQAIETRGSVYTEKQYLRMIEFKTAALFQAAMEMGSASNRASEHAKRCLAEYGLNLGIAFQLQDDLLDFSGSATRMRKPAGVDVGKQRPTILTVKLCDKLKTTRAALARRSMRRIRQLAVATRVIHEAACLTRVYASRAITALETMKDTPAKKLLITIAEEGEQRDC